MLALKPGTHVLLLTSLLAMSPAQADYVVKRIKCAEATNSQPRIIYYNTSDTTRTISIQVTRDGCSPKGGGGQIFTLKVDSAGSQQVGMPRGPYSRVSHYSVTNAGTARVYFQPSAGPARGTFDIQFELD